MINGNYVSVYEIIERVYDMFDKEDIEFSVIVRHIADALKLVSSVRTMNDEVAEVDIVAFRGALPQNMVYINQIRDCETQAPFRYTGNSFHHAINADSPDIGRESQLTYSLNQNVIFTNMEEGKIQISYRALPVDDKGYPMIPDDIKFKLAMENYVMERIAFKLFLKGRLSESKYEKINKERLWYMGSAQSRANMPSPDELELLKNTFSRLLTNTQSHSTFFTDKSSPESITIQPLNKYRK